ncbi:hypothetical protein M0802_007893 [Mischocyttarus mexicanus]|nr:hypothetical protein M0802_007893 [Mischocyttarus mexicanus]
MAGDFNAKNIAWNDKITNNRGRHLANWMFNNCIAYKAILLSPSKPTYPKAGSFLDHCIMDMRILADDLVDGKLQTLPYDSDHDAIKLTVYIDKTYMGLNGNTTGQPHQFNYKRANWRKFSKNLVETSQTHIPHNRNLSTREIDHSRARNEHHGSNTKNYS